MSLLLNSSSASAVAKKLTSDLGRVAAGSGASLAGFRGCKRPTQQCVCVYACVRDTSYMFVWYVDSTLNK